MGFPRYAGDCRLLLAACPTVCHCWKCWCSWILIADFHIPREACACSGGTAVLLFLPTGVEVTRTPQQHLHTGVVLQGLIIDQLQEANLS